MLLFLPVRQTVFSAMGGNTAVRVELPAGTNPGQINREAGRVKQQNKAVAFIDEANFGKQAEEIGYRIDYHRLSAYLRENFDLFRAYLYAGMDLRHPPIKNFASYLKRSGFRLINRRGPERADGSFKSDIDVILAVDMVSMVDWYDTAILLSADGDFAPALEAVSRKGVRVVLISRKDRTAEALVDLTDEFVDLNEIIGQIGSRWEPNGEASGREPDEGDAAAALFRRLLTGLRAEDLPYRLGDLNTEMRQMDPTFDIRATGYGKFSKLAEAFQERGAIRIGVYSDGTQSLDALDLSKL